MIKKIDGRLLLLKSYAGRGTGKNQHITKKDYQYHVYCRGFGDMGYIHLGGKQLIVIPNDLIGQEVRLVLEVIKK